MIAAPIARRCRGGGGVAAAAFARRTSAAAGTATASSSAVPALCRRFLRCSSVVAASNGGTTVAVLGFDGGAATRSNNRRLWFSSSSSSPTVRDDVDEEGDAERGSTHVAAAAASIAAEVAGDGSVVILRWFGSTSGVASTFHAQWLWLNDPTHVHASSGQRTRSPSSFFFPATASGDAGGGSGGGPRKIASADVVEIENAGEGSSSSSSSSSSPPAASAVVPSSPPPPPGCLLPVGSVYSATERQLPAGDDDEATEGAEGRANHGTASRVLRVTWEATEGGGVVTSYYDLDWLERCRYDDDALRRLREETAIHVGIALSKSGSPISEFDYRDLLNCDADDGSDDALYRALDAVVRNGACLIRNAPPSIAQQRDPPESSPLSSSPLTDEEAVVAGIGKMMAGGRLSHGHLYGDVFHVRSVVDAHNIAYTSVPLQPHQDLGYYESKPGLQLLHCRTNAGTRGGESTLIDAMAAAETFRRLAPDLFQVLTSCDATFIKQRNDADMVYRSPHIDVDGSGDVVGVRWSPPFEGPLCIPQDLVEDYFVAYAAFERMLDNSLPSEPYLPSLSLSLEIELRDYAEEHTWVQQLEEGDVLVFNNQRMLHGRRGFELVEGSGGDDDEASPSRHLIGCYTNMEETLNTWRLLRRKQMKAGSSSIGWYQRNAGNGSSGVQ